MTWGLLHVFNTITLFLILPRALKSVPNLNVESDLIQNAVQSQ